MLDLIFLPAIFTDTNKYSYNIKLNLNNNNQSGRLK